MSIINTPRLDRLWQEAQIYPEWATTRLWEYIFKNVVFPDKKWIVSSQQPPTRQEGELRRVDLVVEKMNKDATIVGTMLFVEAKRANASPIDIEEVEYQAFTAACAYYVETGVEHIWTMTCVGGLARLWIYNQSSTYLIPFVPGGRGLADKSEYLEIAVDGETILAGLEYIKEHMTPPRELLQNEPSPRPAHATLPQHWHDTEVVQLDQLRHQADAPNFGQAAENDAVLASTQPFGVYWPDQNTSGWAAEQEPLTYSSQADIEQLHAPNAGPSYEQEESRKEMEVKVTRVKHLVQPEELVFSDRKKQKVSTRKDDWMKATRDGRTVWLYKHGQKTNYWTKKLG